MRDETADTARQSVGGTFNNTLANFNAAGETLDLKGFTFNVADPAYLSNGSTLTVMGGSGGTQEETFTLSNGAHAYTASSDNNGGTLITAVCFAQGTRIRTMRGDVAVEDMRVGDLVVTASGAPRPIRWLGHRTLDCRRHPRPREAWPIRISAHALGQNRPARDLFVSPGHAICVDLLGEVLIPAGAFVNGATIRQVEVDEVVYWHVELDSHDVILADGLLCESYFDMGNRGFFADGKVVALDATPDADVARRTHADFCRPFHDAGPLVDFVRSQLRKRVADLGWSLSDAIEMHLEVDRRRIEPVLRGGVARFDVPAGHGDIWLVTPTTRPCDTSDSSDIRDLGVYVAGLRIEDGLSPPREVAIDDPLLRVGFHAAEGGCRWTAGRACLPAALWQGCEDGFFLRIELAGRPVARWTRATETGAATSEVA